MEQAPISLNGHPSPFPGRIGRTLADSVPDWASRAPQARRPNVIVILCDDLGFSDIGCFGSEIETPNIDAMAASGALLANFHSTPLCSPSRAALLTGMNHHEAGVGNLAYADRGFPGYRGQLAEDVLTAAEVFRHNGYRTLMVGKWHLSHVNDHSDAASRANWPLQRGFDRFYGFMEAGLTNFHEPNLLHADNHAVETDRYPDGYYFTDDITDRAIDMIRGVQGSDPSTPFFLYLAHGAAHAPLMGKPADIAKYRGRYDVGWDAARAARFTRQKELGILPHGAELPTRNSEPGYDSDPWDSLDDRERVLFARYMEVYAGMVDNIDQNLGRLRAALAQLGELDNTVILFTADNGASREGGKRGTTEYYRTTFAAASHSGDPEDNFEKDFSRLDLIGGPRVMAHYPWAWAEVSNTPFRLHKGTTFRGGHHVACVLSWPGRIKDAGVVRKGYAHLIDVLPTLVDVIGLDVPTNRGGLPAKPMSGTSFAPMLADARHPGAHVEQYYEISGHRGYYKDGWEAVTLHYPGADFEKEEWQLFNVTDDPAQARDLSGEFGERVTELAAAFDAAAWANQVYPIDDGLGMFRLDDPGIAPVTDPIVLPSGTPTVERSTAARWTVYRSFVARVLLEHRPSDTGVLVSHGDQGGGYCVYVAEDGELTYAHNGYGSLSLVPAGRLPEGAVDIEIDVDASTPGVWNLRVSVNGELRCANPDLVALGILAPFQGIDVGRSRRSPVHWELRERHGSFPYTGTIHTVTYVPGLPSLSPVDLVAAELATEGRHQ